jgi:hypothetical protein
MKYFYDGERGPTKDRIQHRQQENAPLFRIGERFEKYDFTAPVVGFKEAITSRLEQLQDTNKYLRLWFSGGVDSRLVLDTSLELGIEFDEIVIIKQALMGETYQLGAISETMFNAVDYIEEIRPKIKKSKITMVDFQAPEFELVFSNPDWIRHTNLWYIHTAIEPNLFYRYVNPIKQMLEEIPDRIDVMGCVQPHIYWDNGWKFVYVDFQFPQNLWHTCDNFLTSPNHPEILHSYVRAITKEFEHRKLRPTKFQENLFVDTNQHMRHIKKLLPEYQIELPRPDASLPKKWNDTWRPNNELFWQANPTFKSTLTLLMCHYARPNPRAFEYYAKLTDWKIVLEEIKFGGILSKEFSA